MWFSTDTVLKESEVISKLHFLLKDALKEDLQALVNDYFLYHSDTTDQSFNTKIQFVSRVHLLHPRDYKNHKVKYGLRDVSISQLQQIPQEKKLEFTKVEGNHAMEDLVDWLVRACQRHLNFLANSHIFEKFDEKIMNRLIEEYKNFLNLKKKNNKMLIVPTKAQDLVWHTHQLNNEKYESEVRELSGVFLNHDDDVTDDVTAIHFRKTQKMWEKTYQKGGTLQFYVLLAILLVALFGGIFSYFALIHYNIFQSIPEITSGMFRRRLIDDFRSMGDGYCRNSCWDNVADCKDSHISWDDSCQDNSTSCQSACEDNHNCVSFAWADYPSSDSEFYGRNAKNCRSLNQGRCVIYYPRIEGYQCETKYTTSDRDEYNCYCKTTSSFSNSCSNLDCGDEQISAVVDEEEYSVVAAVTGVLFLCCFCGCCVKTTSNR